MKQADLHPNEELRLETLLRYEILDTNDEGAFDDLTTLASSLCGTPISLISLIDDKRQWFKSRVGLDATETSRSIAFCSHAILEDGLFQVSNTLEDQRFFDNPLVLGPPDIRFYAGAPLIAPNGCAIGTLCVIDRESKTLTLEQEMALTILARQVISQLELRLHNKRLMRLNKNREQLFAMLAHDLRSPFNAVMGLSKILSKRADKLSPAQVVEASQSILSSSIQVYQVLDEVLQWSQHTLSSLECHKQNITLWHAVESAIELLLDTAKVNSIQIINEIPHDLTVYSDPIITKTVIRNLVANAIKYSAANGRISLGCAKFDDHIEVHVKNIGEGVPADIRDNLFTKNVTSTTGMHGESGHGLGLMLCKQFLNLQHNSIWLDESYTQGACFIFDLAREKQ